jgi:hypothetical protein
MNNIEKIKILRDELKTLETWLKYNTELVGADCEEGDKLKEVQEILKITK